MLVIATIPIPDPPDEVTEDATHSFCSAGLSGFRNLGNMVQISIPSFFIMAEILDRLRQECQ
jgi:hypothetical protein